MSIKVDVFEGEDVKKVFGMFVYVVLGLFVFCLGFGFWACWGSVGVSNCFKFLSVVSIVFVSGIPSLVDSWPLTYLGSTLLTHFAE